MTSPDTQKVVEKLGVARGIVWSEGLGCVMKIDWEKFLPRCYKRYLGNQDE